MTYQGFSIGQGKEVSGSASFSLRSAAHRWLSPVAVTLGALMPPALFSQEKGGPSPSSPSNSVNALPDREDPRAASRQERSWLKVFGGRLASDDAGKDSLALNLAEAKVRVEQGLTKLPLATLATVTTDGKITFSNRFELVARHSDRGRDELMGLVCSIEEAELSLQIVRVRSAELERAIDEINPYVRLLQNVRSHKGELEETNSKRAKEIGKKKDSLTLLQSYLSSLQSGDPLPKELKRKVGDLSPEEVSQSIVGLEKALGVSTQALADTQQKLGLLAHELARISRLERERRGMPIATDWRVLQARSRRTRKSASSSKKCFSRLLLTT